MAYNYDIPFHVDLTDRVALVTGGNGGIGGMFCRALAACGATVIVLGRNLERCRMVADEINAGGGKADAIAGDVTDEAAMLRVKEEIGLDPVYGARPLKRLIQRQVVDNVANLIIDGQLHEGDTVKVDVGADDIQKEFDLNMRGTWLPSKVMTPLLIGQQGACVLNVSSMSAFTPLTRIPGYSGAKAGVSNFTQWLATYLARSGVRVNAIAPGFFMTEQNHALQFNPDGTPTPRCAHIVDGTPMRRYGELRELIGAMLFLVDERAASFVTGIVLPVDGGYSAFSGV